MTFVCGRCGVEFQGRAYPKRKYCSLECSALASRGRSGPGIGRPPIGQAARFWPKVDRSDPEGCWPFLGYLDQDGYGKFDNEHAHRVAWKLTNGPIPEGMLVCHSCDQKWPAGVFTYRRCCQPAHLFLGTIGDNDADMVAKGRQARGERNAAARLTLKEVERIREMYRQGGVSYVQLAASYGVTKGAIGLIVRGETWKADSEPLPVDQQLRAMGAKTLPGLE